MAELMVLTIGQLSTAYTSTIRSASGHTIETIAVLRRRKDWKLNKDEEESDVLRQGGD